MILGQMPEPDSIGDADQSGIHRHLPGEDSEQRGLAAAVVPDHPNPLAAVNGKFQPVEDDSTAESFFNISQRGKSHDLEPLTKCHATAMGRTFRPHSASLLLAIPISDTTRRRSLVAAGNCVVAAASHFVRGSYHLSGNPSPIKSNA